MLRAVSADGGRPGRGQPTILKDRRAVQLEDRVLGILILLCVAHVGWCLAVSRAGRGIVNEGAPLAVYELGDWIATTGEPSRGEGDDGDNVHAECGPDSSAKWKES